METAAKNMIKPFSIFQIFTMIDLKSMLWKTNCFDLDLGDAVKIELMSLSKKGLHGYEEYNRCPVYLIGNSIFISSLIR